MWPCSCYGKACSKIADLIGKPLALISHPSISRQGQSGSRALEEERPEPEPEAEPPLEPIDPSNCCSDDCPSVETRA